MKYKTFGRTGLDISAIGLGTEYLINLPRETVIAVIHRAIDQGINYFDHFFAQPQFRDNMGAAFRGYRDNVILTAHLGAGDFDGQYNKTRDPKICEHFFLDFLTRYHTDYVDIIFLHNSDSQEDYEHLMEPGGLLEMASRFQQEGKTRFIGFSGHNTITAQQAAESGYIDVLLFPINFTGHAMPGKKELLDACVSCQVDVVAMKPFAGGNLLKEDPILDIADHQMGRRQMAGAPMRFRKNTMITPVQCLSYALAQVGVSTVIPGCASVEQLEASLAYLEATEEEKDYAALLSDFMQYRTGQCVHCNHCLPCPSEIDIGQTIRLLQMAQQQLTSELQTAYLALSIKASDCIQCGDCVVRCPFGVDVISHMEQAVSVFE